MSKTGSVFVLSIFSGLLLTILNTERRAFADVGDCEGVEDVCTNNSGTIECTGARGSDTFYVHTADVISYKYMIVFGTWGDLDQEFCCEFYIVGDGGDDDEQQLCGGNDGVQDTVIANSSADDECGVYGEDYFGSNNYCDSYTASGCW